MKIQTLEVTMKIIKKTGLIVALMLVTLLWACNGQSKQKNQIDDSEWSASFDSLELEFGKIREAYKQDSVHMSPESRMIYHNMERLWTQMDNMRKGSMQKTRKENGRGMMGNHGMMSHNGMMGEGMSMMRFHNMNQQMMSYAQGMHQMMQQSGNNNMAAMYGLMTTRMQQMISKLPNNTSSSPPASETSGAGASGASLYAAQCSSCHGQDGSGIRGAFPPLNGSSIVQGDKETLTKILLHGLQGQISVKGDNYNGTMPAFGSVLSDEQISAILTYVRSMPDNESSNVSAEDVSSVRGETASRRRIWTPDELGIK